MRRLVAWNLKTSGTTSGTTFNRTRRASQLSLVTPVNA